MSHQPDQPLIINLAPNTTEFVSLRSIDNQ